MKKKAIGIAVMLIIVIGLSIFFLVGRKSEEIQPVMAHSEAEPTVEPTIVAVVEPTTAPTPEPTIEPTPEPMSESDIIELDKTMYAISSVNLRADASSESDKVGGLTQNQEVHVIGQSKSTNWYMLEIDGVDIAFVSDKYLSDTKVEVKASTGGTAGQNSSEGVTDAWGNWYPSVEDWMKAIGATDGSEIKHGTANYDIDTSQGHGNIFE